MRLRYKSDSTAQKVQEACNQLCILLLRDKIIDIFEVGTTHTRQAGVTCHRSDQIIGASTMTENQFISVLDMFKIIRAAKSGKHGFYITIGDARHKIFVESVTID